MNQFVNRTKPNSVTHIISKSCCNFIRNTRMRFLFYNTNSIRRIFLKMHTLLQAEHKGSTSVKPKPATGKDPQPFPSVHLT